MSAMLALLLGATAASAPVSAAPCPQADLSRLAPARQATVARAIAEACRIAATPEFAARLRERSLERRCPGFFAARSYPVTADSVLAAQAEIPAFEVIEEAHRNRDVTAVTRLGRRQIALRPSWIDRASAPGAAAFGDLVNTMAHEMLHLLPLEGRRSTYRFSDRGFSMPWCRGRALVSYTVGDLVERQWRQESGVPED